MVPERLAGEDVGEVHFDEGEFYRRQRIAQRHAGVGESRRIDDDELRAVAGGLLHPVDQGCFGIALEGHQGGTLRLGACCQARVDLVESSGAVDRRLPRAEQIEVRAVSTRTDACRVSPAWLGLSYRPVAELRKLSSISRKLTAPTACRPALRHLTR
jgi:hypothetical protein